MGVKRLLNPYRLSDLPKKMKEIQGTVKTGAISVALVTEGVQGAA